MQTANSQCLSVLQKEGHNERPISSTGLGYLYMMHFVSAIPNSGLYHEFKEFNNDLPYTCATSTLRSDDNGVVKVPTGLGVGIEIDPAYIAKHGVVKL